MEVNGIFGEYGVHDFEGSGVRGSHHPFSSHQARCCKRLARSQYRSESAQWRMSLVCYNLLEELAVSLPGHKNGVLSDWGANEKRDQ